MFEGCTGCCLSIILIPVLCVVVAACGVIYVVANAPSAPISDNFTPSAADAQALDNEIARAVGQASGGWFSLRFTEQQLSSWMALEGRDFADQQGHRFPFEDVQVGLDKGEFKFYGELTQSGIGLPVLVTVEPRIDTAGHADFNITKVDVGGIRVPDAVLRTVSEQLQEVLLQPFDDLPGDYVLWQPTLRVQDGVFEVQGQTVP